MLVVNWQRQTTAGGTEENYFYCDSIEQAEGFKKALEGSNNGKVNFIIDEKGQTTNTAGGRLDNIRQTKQK